MRARSVGGSMRSWGTSNTTKWLVGAAFLAALVVAGNTPRLRAQASIQGQWNTLPYLMPINPVHPTILNNGKVLIVSGSGNVATETNFRSTIWDLQAGTFNTRSHAWDMFCNGMVVLPDGRVLINGGNLQYDPFRGHKKNAVYDPATNTFTDVQAMAHGRWYPTPIVLGDGSVMTFSGLNDIDGSTNTTVEIYTAGSGWSQEYPAGWTPPLYPRMHLITDGRVFYSGSGRGSRFFNPSTKTWSAVVATTNYSGTRTYGTSVLLPLSGANGYKSRVLILGGGSPATATTEIIDLSAATPVWTFGPSMSQARIEMNATILPSGKVLVMGGSVNDEDAATASLNADLYDPKTNTFSSAGANVYPRLYHSGSLLLPDGTVALMGGNPTRGSYEQHIEIYSPAYLFNSDGSPAPRPTMGAVQGTINYGGAFNIPTADAGQIRSVVLMRPSSQTHAFDMDQRLVELSFTTGSGVVTATAPPHGNVAPPGYYMLFILNANGVPSVARFVKLATGAPANQAPTATISNPSSNVTINANGSVSFAGSGSDPDGTIASYAWTFAGGSPATSTATTPGTVTYSTAGTYTASLAVTDNAGATSAAATRTVTVTDFSLSATPNSNTVSAGTGASYTTTVSAINGFSGAVTLGVIGLPTGATASFTPTSVTGSGSSTLAVATTTSTPTGTYTLTVNGTNGSLTRSTNITLVVTAPVNQVPTATIGSPSSNVTINPGSAVSFAGSGSDTDGSIASYAWTFAGGSPSTSTSSTPGLVTYSAPGSYTASLTVSDNGGASSTPATRTVTVGDFSLSATPGSNTVLPGSGASYTATVSAINGFTGAVGLSVLGLPAGATASFTPASVTGSGTSTLAVSTSTSTSPGTYTLTITGTYGSITRSTSVTLVVAGNYQLGATPSSRTVAKNASAIYTISVLPGTGFSGSVTLSIGTLPKFVTARLSPSTINASTTSTVTLDTKKQVTSGTYTVTVTGNSNGQVRTIDLTLTIQ